MDSYFPSLVQAQGAAYSSGKTHQTNDQAGSDIGEVEAKLVLLGHFGWDTKHLEEDLHFQESRDLSGVVTEDETTHGHEDGHDDGADGDIGDLGQLLALLAVLLVSELLLAVAGLHGMVGRRHRRGGIAVVRIVLLREELHGGRWMVDEYEKRKKKN